MLKWFKTKERIFWISAILLTTFIIGPATADGNNFSLTTNAGIPTILRNGKLVSPPIYIGDNLSVPISGSLTCSGTNAAGQECTIDSASYSFPNPIISYSTDGGKTFISGGGSVSISNVDTKHGTATLNASFQDAGYYKIIFGVHVDYTSSTCGNGSKDATGYLYYAVAAPDFSMNPNPNALSIIRGFDASTLVTIIPYNGFAGTVTFSMSGQQGIVANGSATPAKPDYANVGVLSTVPVGSYPTSLRGTSEFGSIPLSHDVPMTINVLPFQIDGPYDNSNSSSHSTTATPSSAVANVRNGDSSITTDSVLVFKVIGNPNTGSYMWLGDTSTWDESSSSSIGLGPFASHESTFSTYNWTNSYMRSENRSGANATYPGGPGYAYNGSSNLQNASGPVGSEVISLSASRSDGESASNTYTIRWHYPSENWRVISSDKPITAIAPDSTAYRTDNGNTTTTMLPGPDSEFPVPAQKFAVEGADGATASIYLGGASAAWPGFADALGLGTGPVGWGVASVLAVAGAYAATITPPAPTAQPQSSGYAQYCADLVTEMNYPNGLPLGYHHFIVKSSSVTLANLYAESLSVQSNHPGDQGADDIYYRPLHGLTNFTGESEQISRVDHYIGDGFGSQGYTSSVKQDLTVFTGFNPEFQWTYAAP